MAQWLRYIALSIFFLAGSPALADEAAQCIGHQEATETLIAAMPGLAPYDLVEGADIGGLAQVVELDPEVGSILAFIHPSAFLPDVGFVLLVVFFDQSGCYLFDAEIPQTAFDEKVKQGRAKVVS